MRSRGSSRQPNTRKRTPAIAMPGADRREVEHAERLAEHLLAHARDDDVRRGADQGDDAAEQRAERHRHQQRGGRGAGAARELKGDRHQHGERADILDEGREQRDRADESNDLPADGREIRSEPADARRSITPERATAALTTSALATMITMSSLKPLKACWAARCRPPPRQQGEHGDEVVAQAAPGEQPHHGDDDGEGRGPDRTSSSAARLSVLAQKKHIGEKSRLGMVRHRESPGPRFSSRSDVTRALLTRERAVAVLVFLA